jgi:hypothetical protein
LSAPGLRSSESRFNNAYRTQQLLGMSVLRAGEQLLPWSLLYNSSAVHYCDEIGDLPHQAQVMGNQQVGQRVNFLKV